MDTRKENENINDITLSNIITSPYHVPNYDNNNKYNKYENRKRIMDEIYRDSGKNVPPNVNKNVVAICGGYITNIHSIDILYHICFDYEWISTNTSTNNDTNTRTRVCTTITNNLITIKYDNLQTSHNLDVNNEMHEPARLLWNLLNGNGMNYLKLDKNVFVRGNPQYAGSGLSMG